MLEIYCDGGCIVGQGRGAYTVIEGRADQEFGVVCSEMIIEEGLTNNQCEYKAMHDAIYHAVIEHNSDTTIYSDSELIVKQINGEYQCKDKSLLLYLNSILDMLELSRCNIKIVHVPRTNKYITACDKINKVMMGL